MDGSNANWLGEVITHVRTHKKERTHFVGRRGFYKQTQQGKAIVLAIVEASSNGYTDRDIMNLFNERGIKNASGHAWTQGNVQNVRVNYGRKLIAAQKKQD